MQRMFIEVFALFSFMLLVAGLALGLMPVSVASGTSCGSAFIASNPSSDNLTDTGEQLCAEARTSHRPAAVALLVAGGVGMLGALSIGMERDEHAVEPEPIDAENAEIPQPR